MSNRAGGDASLTAKIQVLDASQESLKKIIADIERLKVQMQAAGPSIDRVTDSVRQLDSAASGDPLGKLGKSLDGALRHAGPAGRDFAALSTNLGGVKTSATTASQSLNLFNSTLGQGNTGVTQFKENVSGIAQGLQSSISAYSAAAISVFGLYNAYDNLAKVQQRSDRAALTLEKAQTRLASLQATYNKQLEGGNLTAEQNAVAQQRIVDATNEVEVASQQANIAASDMSKTMAGFASQVLPFAATAMFSVVNMIGQIKTEMAAGTLSTGMFTGAIHGLNAAMRALVTSHPVLLGLMIAGTAAMAAFATNLFGVRDAINAVGEAIAAAIPPLKPFLDMLGGINSMFGETSQSVDSTAAEMTNSFQGLDTSIASSVSKINTNIKSISFTLDQSIVESLDRIKKLMDKVASDKGIFEVKPRIEEKQMELIVDTARDFFGDQTLEIDVQFPEGGLLFANQAKSISQHIDFLATKIHGFAGGESIKRMHEALGFSGLEDAEERIKSFHESLNKIGDVLIDANGKVIITSKQFDMLLNLMGEEGPHRTDEFRQAFEKYIGVIESSYVPLNGFMVANEASLESSEKLKAELNMIEKAFRTNIDPIYGVTEAVDQQKAILDLAAAVMTEYKYSAEEIADMQKRLEKIFTDSNKEIAKSNKDAAKELKEVIRTGGDIGTTAKIIGLGLKDVKSAYDTADESVHKSMGTFREWAASGTASNEQVLKAITLMASGHFGAVSGMDDATKESMETLRQWWKTLSPDQKKLALQDILNGEVIPAIGDLDLILEGSIATLEDFNKHVEQTAIVSDTALKQFNIAWDMGKEAIRSATDPAPINAFIEKLKVMAETPGISEVDKQTILLMIDQLQIYSNRLNVATDSKKAMAEETIRLAQELGVTGQGINNLIEAIENKTEVQERDLVNAQNSILVSKEESLAHNEVALSMLDELAVRTQVVDSIAEMDEAVAAEIITQDQLEKSAAAVAARYGIDWPAGIAVTIENIKSLIGANEGLEDSQHALDQALIDAAGGLSAFDQAEKDLTDTIAENARQMGVSTRAIAIYNNSRNSAGIADKQQQNTLQGLTQAMINGGRSTQFMTLNVQQMRAASQAGDVQFRAFMHGIQVESHQSRRYAQLLTEQLIRMGVAAAKARAMVNQSIGDAENMIRKLSGIAGIKEPKLDSGGSPGGGSPGGGGGQKQKIDKKAIREQAIQDAIKETSAVDHLVKKLIDETDQIHKLGLATGVSRKEMEQYVKATNEFGIATEKAKINLLELAEVQARQVDFLTNSSEKYKDYIRANIDGITKANDFTREVRRNVQSLEAQREQLFHLTRMLGISLPSALQPTIKNLQDLISASYGSEEAMEALKKTALSATDFYRKTIEEAKKAIEDAKFEEFVKKELLFENLGDEFFRNISRELQAEMKLDKISEQLRKQLGLIQLNPKMFEMNVSAAELRTGVQNTITAIEQEIAGNPRLTELWTPILDELNAVLVSPDIHAAVQGFAQLFPDLVEPALLGVVNALEGLDTTINETFSDSKTEAIKEVDKTMDNLSKTTDKLYKELLKAAKAANDLGGGGGGGKGLGGVSDALNDVVPATGNAVVGMAKIPPTLDQVNNAFRVAGGQWPLPFKDLPKHSKPTFETLQRDAVATMIQMGRSFDQLPTSLQQAVAKMPPEHRAALGIMENDAGKATATIADDFTIIPPAAKDAGTQGADQFGTAIAEIDPLTGKATQGAITQLATLAPEGTATGDQTATNLDTALAQAKEYVTATVVEMGQRFYKLAEFVESNFNPNFAKIVQIGFAMLPPIVMVEVANMGTEYARLSVTLPQITTHTVGQIDLVLQQLPLNMALAVNIMHVNYTTGMQKIQIQTQTTINDITTRLGTLGPVTTGVVNMMVKAWSDGMAKFPPVAQTAVNNITNTLGTLVAVTTGVASRMVTEFAKFAAGAKSTMDKFAQDVKAAFDKAESSAKSATSKITSYIKSLPTYKLFIYEIRTVYTTSGSRAAEGTAQVVGKETHFIAGEGNRPEIVTVTPLSSDIFDNTGKADRSLSVGMEQLTDTLTLPAPDIMSSGGGGSAAAVSFKSADIGGGGGGGHRTITVNLNQPIILNGNEIGRNIVSKSFEDIDSQT